MQQRTIRLSAEQAGAGAMQLVVTSDEALAVLLNARGAFAGAYVKKFANPQGPYPLNDPDITDRYRFQLHGDLRLSTR